MNKGKLFIITGTSAVGKTTVANLVLKKIKNLARSLTYTTRDIRPKEKNGRDYHFISQNEFGQKIKRSDFLEWANNYGNLYGTDKKDITSHLNRGKNILVVIDIKGALEIKKKWPEATVIFILPESIKQLEQRFKKRHDTSPADVKKRLKTATWELKQGQLSDFWVINRENQINLAVQDVEKIISANI
jgi:guanylate kinase